MSTGVAELRSYLRLGPFETSTEVGRARERHRRLAITTLTSGFARAIAAATAMISVPLTITYLGTERYGLWMTVSSVVWMLGFADFGLGNGLLNAISRATGTDDPDRVKKCVSSGFFMLLGIGAFVVAALALSYPFVPWARIFNVTTTVGKQEAGPVAAVLVCCLAAALPSGVVQRVQAGYQEGFLNDLWQGLGNLLALAALVTAVTCRFGLPWLVLAVAGVPIVTAGLNSGNQFGFRRRWLAPRLGHFDWKTSRALATSGFLFFILQIEYVLTYSSDNLVVAQLLGAGAVAQYAVTQKVFSLVGMVQSCWLVPLWPAYSEAIARGDTEWVHRTLLRSIVGSAVWAASVSGLILVFGHALFAVWLRGRIAVDFNLMVALAVWTVVQCVGAAIATYLNGSNSLRFEAATGLGLTLLAPLLRVVLGRHFGLAGIPWGVTFAYLIAVGIPTMVYIPMVLYSRVSRR